MMNSEAPKAETAALDRRSLLGKMCESTRARRMARRTRCHRAIRSSVSTAPSRIYLVGRFAQPGAVQLRPRRRCSLPRLGQPKRSSAGSSTATTSMDSSGHLQDHRQRDHPRHRHPRRRCDRRARHRAVRSVQQRPGLRPHTGLTVRCGPAWQLAPMVKRKLS
jgi:hypothetical protein